MKTSKLTYMERKLYAPKWIRAIKTAAGCFALIVAILFIVLCEDIVEYIFYLAFGWYA